MVFSHPALPPLLVSIPLVAFAGSGAPAYGQPPAKTAPTSAAPQLTVKTLPSGLRLLAQNRPQSPLVALALSVRTGTGSENGQNSGAAHLIEHMVFKGSPTNKPGEIDAQMENLGGEVTARTSRDQTLYTVTVPKENWQKALMVLADMLARPAFRQADLEAEKRVIARENAAALTEAARTGFAQLAGEAYPEDSAYRFPLMGQAESFARLTPDDLRAFWQAHYAPGNLTLVVVGDVAPAQAEEAARPLFAAAPSQTPSPAPDMPVSFEPAPTQIVPAAPSAETPAPLLPPVGGVRRARALPAAETPERDLTTVLLGFFVPAPDAAEKNQQNAALRVLSRWLARGNNAGVLEKTLVLDRKQAINADADYVPGQQGGLLFVSAIFTQENAQKGEKYLIDALRRLREDDLVSGDIELAKRTLLGEIRYQNETVEEQAKFLAQNDLLHPQILTAEANAALIEAVSVGDVRNVLREYLTPARYAAVVVGPEAAPPAAPAEGRLP